MKILIQESMANLAKISITKFDIFSSIILSFECFDKVYN